MELIFGILVGLFVLVVLVVLHELGHAISARRNGVVVEEFGIGFPPRAWKKKLKNGVLLTLNWLPLGGFVKLQGEHDSASGKGDYGAATYWQKTKILLAGVLINWIAAAVILTGLAWAGLPKILDNQFSIASDTTTVTRPVEIVQVQDGSPADEAGLQAGDQVLRFAGRSVPDSQQLSVLTEEFRGEEVAIVYSRGGIEETTRAQLREGTDGDQAFLGIGSNQRELLRATWSAPLVGVGTTAQFTWLTLQGIGDILGNLARGAVMSLSFNADQRAEGRSTVGSVGDNVAGPVGILGVIFPAAEQAGLTQLLLLTAIISLTLAVINALPIPALDGGRWFLMTLFKLLRRPLTRDREESIQAIGFLVLIGLIILVTIADVGKLIS